MFNAHRLALACAWLFASSGPAHAGPKAEVIHWWTSGGESAAVKQVAQAYRSAGGVWVDMARTDIDASQADQCAQKGIATLKDRTRVVGVPEVYLSPDQNGAIQDVVTAFWDTGMTVDKAQKNIAAALKD